MPDTSPLITSASCSRLLIPGLDPGARL
jgi:hypothetical protein